MYKYAVAGESKFLISHRLGLAPVWRELSKTKLYSTVPFDFSCLPKRPS